MVASEQTFCLRTRQQWNPYMYPNSATATLKDDVYLKDDTILNEFTVYSNLIKFPKLTKNNCVCMNLQVNNMKGDIC